MLALRHTAVAWVWAAIAQWARARCLPAEPVDSRGTGTAHPTRQAGAPMCGCCALASAAMLGVWLGACHVSNMPEAFTWGGVQDKLLGVLGV